jgi:hypothetical protein
MVAEALPADGYKGRAVLQRLLVLFEAADATAAMVAGGVGMGSASMAKVETMKVALVLVVD